ncbi:MAG: hypothetical protein QM647_04225 [Asticcacaulis sp.]|uniref:hypothetical protein n=1 Tax=Asticcacaulis sp. TaxID=1872648 RepID=UPI0039E5B2E0
MSEFTQFLWAMWDSLQAALVSLNPVPVVVFSLFLGLIRSRRLPAWLATVLAVIPAMIVTALLPMAMGYQAIWPDLTQLEIQFQIAILLALSYVLIRAVSLIKVSLMTMAVKPGSQKPV